jgi:tetratricopeptide (TPR) repeat protein
VKWIFALVFPLVAATHALADPAAPARFQPELDQAFARLYSSDFDGAQTVLDRYIGAHPDDPVAYSVKASGYVFSELHRLGILQADFFQDDKQIADHKKALHPDPKTRDAFYLAVNKAQEVANRQLARQPGDPNALFALCLAKGNLTDYIALIEKHQMQSFSVNKEGYRDAKKLLAIAPDYYDAYLTTGFTEYLIGSVPVIFRWFVKFDDVQGDKKHGIQNLQLVAEKGHYLKPFAKILLATAYLRDKKYDDAKALLRELTEAYPQNALLKHELDRLSARM